MLPSLFLTYNQHLLFSAYSALLLLQSWLKWLALVLKNSAPHLFARTGFHLLCTQHKRYWVKYMIFFISCRFLPWPWRCPIWAPAITALSKGLIRILCVRLSHPLHLHAAQRFVSGKAQLHLHVRSMCVTCFYIVRLLRLMSVLLFLQSPFCVTVCNAQGRLAGWGRSVQIPSESCFPSMKHLYFRSIWSISHIEHTAAR